VSSEGAGTGSIFTIVLPRGTRDTDAPQGHAREPLPPGQRILLVDDNRDAVETMAAVFRLQGQEVFVAYDGESGFELAAEHHPRIALLDIGLPSMDGYELARRIRQAPWGEDMLLVALTGWGQEQDRRKSSEAGFDAHLVKPMEAGQLSADLQSLLEAGAG